MEKIGGSVKIRKIAVTGRLSTGKSTVCDILRENGAFVIKADDIVHDLLSCDPNVIDQVVKAFGKEFLIGDNQKNGINRKNLAKMVFEDSKKLASLEAILHPKVKLRIEEIYQTVKDNLTFKAFVVEIPFLFNLHFEHFFDLVVSVLSDDSLAKKRFINKGYPEDQFAKRTKRFPSIETFKEKSDLIILNNGSLEDLQREVKHIL